MKRNNIPEILFSKIDMVKPYPYSVVEIEQMLKFTAFYPGGFGLWLEEESNIWPQIVVVGQDFGTLTDYKKMKKDNYPDLKCATWRNLLSFFKEVDINPCNCFFTNAFMGLRKEGSITGIFPGMKDKAFTQRNIEYLKYQIEVIKPKVILVLGAPASIMLSSLSTELGVWGKNRSFSYFDKIGCSVIHDVMFNGIKFSCVRLLHPSFRKSNLKYRKFGQYTGNDAEIMMVKEALKRQKVK
jgi:hypothetical protein